MGFIEQRKGNFDAMQTCYKKSLFLSPFDHLPLYAFASYYKETGEEQKAGSYYKSAEKAWKNKRSVHSSCCRRMYYSDTEKDDVIPQGLLDYITPVFQTQAYDTN
jgi:tetratricopeptide (TPR) repeat protein